MIHIVQLFKIIRNNSTNRYLFLEDQNKPLYLLPLLSTRPRSDNSRTFGSKTQSNATNHPRETYYDCCYYKSYLLPRRLEEQETAQASEHIEKTREHNNSNNICFIDYS